MGLVQAEKALPSMLHSKVRLPAGVTLSVPVNEKLAEDELLGFDGCAVIVVSGGVVSAAATFTVGSDGDTVNPEPLHPFELKLLNAVVPQVLVPDVLAVAPNVI